MAASESAAPRIVDSLLGAVRRLESARDPRAVREAIRDCALAIEFRLDTLARELEPGGGLEPELLPAGRAIDQALRGILVDAWQLLGAGDDALMDRSRLARFTRDIARAARQEAELAFARLSLPEAID